MLKASPTVKSFVLAASSNTGASRVPNVMAKESPAETAETPPCAAAGMRLVIQSSPHATTVPSRLSASETLLPAETATTLLLAAAGTSSLWLWDAPHAYTAPFTTASAW